MDGIQYITVTAIDGERWDQLAWRAYGICFPAGGPGVTAASPGSSGTMTNVRVDVTGMNGLIAANPLIGITDRLDGGTLVVVPIVVPVASAVSASVLPPWKM